MKAICDHADQCGLDINECEHSRSHELEFGCAGWCSVLNTNTKCIILPYCFQDHEDLDEI